MIRITFSPAMAPASLVAWRCESLKYAGTVTTAFLTVLPREDSAISFIFTRIIEETSSAENCFFSALYSTSIMGLSAGPLMTVKGHSFMSLCTAESWNLRPIRRLASKTEFLGFIATWLLAPDRGRRQEPGGDEPQELGLRRQAPDRPQVPGLGRAERHEAVALHGHQGPRRQAHDRGGVQGREEAVLRRGGLLDDPCEDEGDRRVLPGQDRQERRGHRARVLQRLAAPG